MSISVEERMNRLERRANVVRSRLLRAVDALDVRRHQVAELGQTAKRLAVPAAISVVGVAAVVGLGALGIGLIIGARRKRSLAYRMKHTLRGLELVRREPSLGKRLFDKAMLTLVSVAGSELGRRALRNVFDGRTPDGRLVWPSRPVLAPKPPIAALPASFVAPPREIGR
jgi:hypothetical protein